MIQVTTIRAKWTVVKFHLLSSSRTQRPEIQNRKENWFWNSEPCTELQRGDAGPGHRGGGTRRQGDGEEGGLRVLYPSLPQAASGAA